MNKTKLHLLSFIGSILLCFTSFSCSMYPETKQDEVFNQIFEIDSKLVECKLSFTDNLSKCMSVKSDSGEFKLGITQIEGFIYEKDYKYKLLVATTILANPPMDSGDRIYKLKKIISKIKD